MTHDYRKTTIAVREPTLTLIRELKRGSQTNDELLLTMATLCDPDDLKDAMGRFRDDSYEDLVQRAAREHGFDYLDLPSPDGDRQ